MCRVHLVRKVEWVTFWFTYAESVHRGTMVPVNRCLHLLFTFLRASMDNLNPERKQNWYSREVLGNCDWCSLPRCSLAAAAHQRNAVAHTHFALLLYIRPAIGYLAKYPKSGNYCRRHHSPWCHALVAYVSTGSTFHPDLQTLIEWFYLFI